MYYRCCIITSHSIIQLYWMYFTRCVCFDAPPPFVFFLLLLLTGRKTPTKQQKYIYNICFYYINKSRSQILERFVQNKSFFLSPYNLHGGINFQGNLIHGLDESIPLKLENFEVNVDCLLLVYQVLPTPQVYISSPIRYVGTGL